MKSQQSFTYLIFTSKLFIIPIIFPFFTPSYFLKIFIESKFRCFTQIANITNWGAIVLVLQGATSTVID